MDVSRSGSRGNSRGTRSTRARGLFVTISAVACATLASTACAAGQDSQTEHEKPSLDGNNGGVGQIQVLGVAFPEPAHGASYRKGSSVPLTAYIANDSDGPEKLIKVSSPAFTGGWAVAPTTTASSLVAGGSSQPQTIPPGQAVGFGLRNLTPSGRTSPKTIVLRGLSTQLWPGMAVKVTFSFSQAGDATITVPVQLTTNPSNRTLPTAPGTPTAG
jgi:copper(I)-binding protein